MKSQPMMNKPTQKQPLSKDTLKKLGIDDEKIGMAKSLDELKEGTPFMVTVTAKKDISFFKDKHHKQTLLKKRTYIMALGMYDQLRWDPHRKEETLKPFKFPFKNVYKPYRGQDLTDKTLLLWRTGGIGDFLFIKPNLQYLKKKYPSCRIWFACGSNYHSMVQEWDEIDRVMDLPLDYYSTFTNADYHLTFEGIIERNEEAHERNAYDLVTDWFGLNLPSDQLIPYQTPNQSLVEKCKNILSTWGLKEKEFVLVQIQPSSPVRTVHPKVWIKLIDKLTEIGYNVVLTDSPAKKNNVELLRQSCKAQNQIFNFAQFSESIAHTVALCSLAEGVIGPDSSLNHIACSLDKPCVGIFGPFLGELRMKYYPKGDWINCKKECAPCFLHGYKPCPEADKDGYSTCFYEEDITDEVINKYRKLTKGE